MGQVVCNCVNPGEDQYYKDDRTTDNSNAKALARFKTQLKSGVSVVKFSASLPPSKITIVMRSTGRTEELVFEGADPADQECSTRPLTNFKIRRATDPDPDVKHFAGTKVLRDNIDPRDAMKAFIFEVKDTTAGVKLNINVQAESENDAEKMIIGFRLLFAEAKKAQGRE
eukprot:CAMPEP_0119489168 /NCGR_PEP_ID=MMETSP1344-20130328/14702_1 /TAXON_ID=236787 /ORGANISM="Florenciella parvula, Strain CCMP2471" /LENGTH=169 /DNA_ID=CAMNT_0007524181 /DNA_START=179 /DNA_END=688 /DNA_ORIENTATION=-